MTLSVREPTEILCLENLLCCNAGSCRLLSQEIREELSRAVPNPKAGRVHLCFDVTLALLDWLLARGWKQELERVPAFCKTVGDLFQRLSSFIKSGASGQNPGLEESLVVRYLIAMASLGVDVTDRSAVIAETFKNDSFRLPRYWAAPGERWRQNVTEEDWNRFLAAWERFWSGKVPQRGHLGRPPRKDWKSLHSRLEENRVPTASRRQKRDAVYPLRETEMGKDAPPVDRRQQSAHAGLSAFASQIVVDPRLLAVGLMLLERTLLLPVEKASERRCACIAVVETAMLSGIATSDVLRVALLPTKELVPATFNAARGCLTIHLASGYHLAILGRIPSQEMDVPLLPHTQEAFRRLADSGYSSVDEAFGTKPLDAFFSDIADLMSTDGLRVFLRRIDLGWLYAAHRLARLNPGVIELLRGDVFGPYRAETSYLTVTEEHLWNCAYKVHDAIFDGLSISVPTNRTPGRSDVFIGKQTASLDEIAAAADALLDQAEAKHLAAHASWILQFLGRRPTADRPHPAAYALQCEGLEAFIVADKNLGCERRNRVVPATETVFEAAMTARRTE